MATVRLILVIDTTIQLRLYYKKDTHVLFVSTCLVLLNVVQNIEYSAEEGILLKEWDYRDFHSLKKCCSSFLWPSIVRTSCTEADILT